MFLIGMYFLLILVLKMKQDFSLKIFSNFNFPNPLVQKKNTESNELGITFYLDFISKEITTYEVRALR